MGIISELVAGGRKFADASELPRALATAGLLTAAGWDWSSPFDAVQARRQLRVRNRSLRGWMLPPPEAFAVILSRRAELASLFQENVIPAGSPLLRRLHLLADQPLHGAPGGDLEEIGQAARMMAAAPQIGTAPIITTEMAGSARKWNWPLRLSIEGVSVEQLKRSFDPVRRGLAEPREYGEPADVAFGRTLQGLAGAHANMTVLVPATGGSSPASVGEMIGLAPSLAVLRDPIDAGQLAKSFVYEMSHDFAPDQALARAMLRGQTPPLVIGRQSFAREMENARLSAQLGGMVRRLERLGEVDDTPVFVSSNAHSAFGIDIDRAPPSVLARAIGDAIGRDGVIYEHEDDAGEATAHIARQVERREQALRAAPRPKSRRPTPRRTREGGATRKKAKPSVRDRRPKETGLESLVPPERDRFTDVAILAGDHFAGDEVREAERIDPKSILPARGKYSLEIAVREKRLGFEVEGEDRPVPPPRRDGETVRIYAAVAALDPGSIKLDDTLLPIDWPFDEDSASAFFRFETLAKLDPGSHFEIRLLSEDLRLLDHLELVFKNRRWRVRPVGLEAPVALPGEDPAEEALALHVVDAPNGYGLIVTLKLKDEPPLEVPLERGYRKDEIAQLLNDVRRHWTTLVIGKMATRTKLTEASFREETEALAGHGRKAWRLLFGDKRDAGAGTGEAFAKLLSNRPVVEGSPLRITYARNAEDFIFPWSIVSPPLARGKASSPRFWGLDYQISLARKEGKAPPPASHPPRFCALVDKNFSAFVDHAATLGRVVKANGRSSISFVSTREEVSAALSDDNPCDIFYFFCQGLMGATNAVLAVDVAAEIEKATADLDEGQREPWRRLLARLKSRDSDARIFADGIELSESELRDMDFFASARRPFVFLNMCHSAGVLPGSRGGLPAVFLDRAASAVVGTEAPVTAQFADVFAERLLSALLRGDTFGSAMRSVRRSFHDERNPLALLYTLYGRGEARLAGAIPIVA